MVVDRPCPPRSLPLFTTTESDMPGYSVPFVHSGDPGYAPPVLRAPSPTDSIGTDYGPDETSPDEDSLSDAEFARMCQQRLGLGDMRPDEMKSNFDPLLPKPKDEDEERGTSTVALLCPLSLDVLL